MSGVRPYTDEELRQYSKARPFDTHLHVTIEKMIAERDALLTCLKDALSEAQHDNHCEYDYRMHIQEEDGCDCWIKRALELTKTLTERK